jgi:cytidylate kinase
MVSFLKEGPVVAIDGPAGTGKSSVTHRLAQRLGFVHIDTGALYRAVAFLTLKRDPSRDHVIKSACEVVESVHFEVQSVAGAVYRIFADGEDLTDRIRTSEVSAMSSQVAVIAQVRSVLLELQRSLGFRGRVILEGRDIGTVVFPHADVKFFLTANLEERAKRRLLELEASGLELPSFEKMKAQILSRDEGDFNRVLAPLKQASDAIEIDTSTLSLDEVVEMMEHRIRKILKL